MLPQHGSSRTVEAIYHTVRDWDFAWYQLLCDSDGQEYHKLLNNDGHIG